MNELIVALLGVVGGVLGGLLGVGGGVIFVPALVVLLDAPQVEAEASSLLAISLVAAAGTWRQRGYGNVRLRDGLVIGALAPVGVAVGVIVANSVPERALELAFAGLLLSVAAQLVRKAFRSAPAAGPAEPV